MDEEKNNIVKSTKRSGRRLLIKSAYKKPLLEVAQEYSLLASTCKSIVNTYMKEGRVGKKNQEFVNQKVVTTYHVILNPLQPLLSQVQMQKCGKLCRAITKSRLETEEVQEENKQELQSLDLSIQQWTQSLLNQIQALNQQYKDPQLLRQN